MIRDRITQLVTYLSRQIRVSVGGVVLGRETGAGSAQELTLDGLSITAGVLTVVGKQATLVSGTNIKTINGSSLLGSGNISTELTSGPVTSSGGVSAIADGALSIGKVSGLQTILDGSNGGNGAGDSGKLAKFTTDGSLRSSTDIGQGFYGSANTGTGIFGTSGTGNGGHFYAESAGGKHILLGKSGNPQAYFDYDCNLKWIRGAYTGGITTAGTLTANRTYTLPDASGTVALLSDINATNVAAVINGATEDSAPFDVDRIPMTETAAAGALRWLSFANLWVWIKSKIDLGQTWAGAHAFSSTTRPTSAGTGTPEANSLITEADMRNQLLTDMTNVYVRQQMGFDAGPWVTVGTSASYLLDGNGVSGARLIGSTTQAAASAQGGGVKYPDGAVTGGTMTFLTRAFQMRFLFRNVGGQAGANAFFVSLRNNADFWSNSSIGLYHVPQPANTWQAATVYAVGDRVNVSGIVHVVSTGGTSGGSVPSWNTTRNGTTTDNTVTWRNLGPHTSGNWALGFVDASGNISLTDTGVAWVTGTSNTTLLSLRSDGTSVFASVNGSAEVSVARGALFAATPYIMGRGDTNLTHRIHGLLFTFTTTPQ